MDSVRSEYSDAGSALGSSRAGGGPSGSSSALSFLDASSFGSSRASTTRTDFVSNYEQKFFRKKEKKKKREKRLAAATSNQLTADDRRRADREAERRARQAEMETWLPTDATLRALDADRRKRSRDRMRHVLRWYPPLEEQEEEGGPEPHATLAGMPPARRRQQLKRQTEIAPLFAPESTDARDARREHQARALRDRIDDDASALQRRVAELQQRLACVERLRLQARPDPTRKRLVPLATTQSAPTLLPHEVSPQPRRKGFGSRHSASATSFLFRDTPQAAAHARAREALELDAFLDAHKREARRHGAACTLQAAWRMARVRRKFLTWRSRRTRARRTWFQLWTLTHRITRHAQRAALRKCFRAWQEDVASVVRLRTLELRLFREAEQLPGDVPKIVRNLVFMADDDDDAYARKVLAHPLQASSYATGFVNAAFASVEQQRRATGGHRVRLLRAQHLEAKRAVAKKIVQRLFLLWKRVHADDQRIGLNAQLCIKRAARQAFRRRPVWAGEKLLTVLELWARYAAFARSKRLGVPLPHFPRPLPLWDVWLHNYQERQVRAVKAAARAPLARMRRCFHRVRAFTAVARHARAARDRATRHGTHKTVRAVLLAWRHAIADAAAQKKKLRTVLRQWGAYATRKSTMRPCKQQLEAARLRREQLRAWTAWRHVQLRSCFTRELHRARLASQPAWRWKVQRVLLTWMDLREPLRKWACFVAWRHCVQRRKLFLTLQRHCAVARRRHLLYGVLGAWKAVVWKQEDAFLEDRLRLSAWDAYRELSPLLPMLFYGSFSDAAALFGGVGAGASAGTPVREDVLASRQRELRAFHAALVQGSVAEARNLILSRRHLVNGVDDATGNTALHVAAAQLDDAVRRVEITTLLLTEGACTGDKPNRHGLTPTQLAADETTRRLLTRGVYAFHADGVLQQPPETENGLAATRLVWCLVARMSSEYVRGDRVGSDVRRAWHSELLDELWLRRGRVSFAATSVFSRTIQRCRAFLNGMKRRVCRSKDDVLLDLWTRVQHRDDLADVPPRLRPTLLPTATRRLLSRDLARVDEKTDLLAWLKNTPDDPTRPGAIQKAMEAQQVQAEEQRLGDRAASLGEYGAYAEALLWPVLQDERAEQALVHTFVGVVFSLSFPVEVVLAQATRLENECARLEDDVLHAYQAIMREELRGRGPEQPHGLPLLRYFTEQSDAEFFFKRELLRLNTELFRGRPSAETDNGSSEHADCATQGTPSRAELQLDADVLLAKAQRKQRKVDKKVAASEQQVARLTDANARVLLAVSKEPSLPRLREICDARIRLEDERLRLAHLRLKQLDWADTIQEIVTLKRSLDDASESGLSINRELLEEQDELLARRAFLQAQLVRYTHELKPVVSSRPGPPTASAVASTTELRRLHKAASTALRALLVRNLFRACCCWLAENLLKHQDKDHAEDPGDAPRDRVSAARVSVANLSEPVASVVTTTFAEARKASVAAHATEGRRRSSLSNAREALDTMQRSAAAGELHEVLANAMQDNYASSSHLLFESDRDAMHAEETRARERALAEEHERSARSAVAEFNPRTGQVETPSSRLLDADEMLAMTHDVDKEQGMDPGGAAGDERAAQRRRNRKRELMRRAMAQRQLQRLAGHPAGHEENSEVVESPVTCSPKTWGPLVDGVVDSEDAGDVGFGTFVVGPAASATAEHKPLRSLLPFVATANKTIAAALAESMWRRGGTVRRHGEPHSASVSLAAASPPKSAAARDPSGSELFASAEDEMAFNTAFRVMSASKERRATPSGRRLSTIGGVAGSGLGAVSPRAQAESIEREDRDVSTPLLEDFDLRLLVEEAEANGAADAMEDGMEDGPVITEQAQDEQRMVCVSPPEVGVVSALASLVSATDETEFFNQTLEQYLALVRRDSLVVTVDRRDSVGDDSGASAAAVSASEQEVPTASSDASSPVVVDERVEDGAAAINQWRTPLIKWEPSPNEPSPPSPPRPLHVESTRLLVPAVAVQTLTACETSLPPSPSQPVAENAVLWNTLRELERKDADERRLQALQKQPLVLSGTTSAMAARRRKASVVSTLLKKDASLKSVRTVLAHDDDPMAVAREETVGTRLEAADESPSVPKILVAIQRKTSHGHKPASGETLASETVPSPTRRQAQHKPLSLPHCDLQLEPAAKKTANPTTTSRRRTTQVEPAQSGASGSLSRQPSRLSVEAAPVAFCLEGARALGPASASKDPLPTAAVDAAGPTLPVLTEEQKRSVWRDFTAARLSDATQDAYAQLHPALYAPVTPEPSTTPTVLLDPRRLSSDAASAGAAVLSVPQQIALDRRFWSAVEGFKSVGNTAALVPLDDKTASRRRVETAVAIYQQFLSPTAPSRLAWLSMYSQELRVVERRLLTAPRALFDALQQTAHLHISTLQAQQR